MTIEDKFSYAVDKFGMICPALLSFYSLIELRENKNIQTMRLNVKEDVNAIFEYNPDFLNELNEALFTSLFGTEIFKMVLHHCTSRVQMPASVFTLASYIVATNETISSLVCLSNETQDLGKCLPTLQNMREYFPKDFNEKDDLYVEKVHAILMKKLGEQMQQMEMMGMGGGSSNEENGEDQNNSGSNGGSNGENEENDNANGKGKNDKKDNGNGNGNDGKDGNGDCKNIPNGNANVKNPKQKELLNKFFSPSAMKENSEMYGENQILDEQVKQEFDRTPTSSWGNMKGDEILRLQMANVRKVDVRQILRRFNTSVTTTEDESTRMKINRRYGLAQPGRRYLEKSKILIAIDGSGSIGGKELEDACQLINSFVKASEVWYCTWDTTCSPFKQSRKELKECILEDIGGGTDPQCIIKRIQKEKVYFDGIVVITDCWFSWEQPKIGSKIFIIRNGNGEMPAWCKYNTDMADLLKIRG